MGDKVYSLGAPFIALLDHLPYLIVAADLATCWNKINGLKRYRYLSDRLGTHKANLYKLSLLVCTGL